MREVAAIYALRLTWVQIVGVLANDDLESMLFSHPRWDLFVALAFGRSETALQWP